MTERLTAEERALDAKVRAARQRVRKANRRERAPRVKPEGKGQRDPRQVMKAHKEAIAALPCLATMIRTGQEAYGVQVAHQRFSHAASGARNPGMQRKSHDWRVLPLSPEEHRLQHRFAATVEHSNNEVAYWADLGLNEDDLARLQRGLVDARGDHAAMLELLRESAATARAFLKNAAKQASAQSAYGPGGYSAQIGAYSAGSSDWPTMMEMVHRDARYGVKPQDEAQANEGQADV